MINEEKYDRQLRLWATSGQQNLQSAEICLVLVSSVGCETLKNLILPGVGSVTIYDDRHVTWDDLSANFFLPEDTIGAPLAEAAASCLAELNPDVQVKGVPSLAADWSRFQMIIFSQLFSNKKLLEEILSTVNGRIPVLEVCSVGFYGYVRVHIDQITVVETHGSSAPDLRLDSPWPALRNEALSAGFDRMSAEQLKDYPYGLMLVYLRDQWDKEHQTPPTRRAFKEYVENCLWVRQVRHLALENVEEMIRNLWRATVQTQVPAEVKEILKREDSGTVFWDLVSALRKFINRHKTLPVLGGLPDMACSTEQYVSLQRIYKEKAQADMAEISKDLEGVDEKVLRAFCKGCKDMVVKDGKKGISPLVLIPEKRREEVGAACLAGFWFLGDDLEELILKAKEELGGEAKVDVIEELHRAQKRENVNISGVIGGLGGQEALKLLTGQYIPLVGGIVFDGVYSEIYKYE